MLVGELVTKGLPDLLPVMRKRQKRGEKEEQDEIRDRAEGALLHPFSPLLCNCTAVNPGS